MIPEIGQAHPGAVLTGERPSDKAGQVQEVGPARRGLPVTRQLWFGAEVVRVAGLLALGIFITRPLLAGQWFGSSDLLWYLQWLQDFIQQAHSGVFPALVGQTEFNPSGYPYVRTVLFLYVASGIDFLTGQSLGSIELLYLTVASAIVSALITMYCSLIVLHKNSRWSAALISAIYVLCPGGLTQAFALQMVPTIMALPFLPVLFAGIVSFIRKASYGSAVAIAVAMALILCTHPWVALWAALFTSFAMLCAVLFRHRNLAALLHLALAGALFLALTAWYLVPIIETGGTTAGSAIPGGFFSQDSFNRIRDYTLGLLPGPVLPLTTIGRDSAQLGYALWLLLLVGVLVALTRRRTLEVSMLALVGVLCTLFLFPVTPISFDLYRVLPAVFAIATLWPEQRLYVILATVAAMTGYLSLEQLKIRRRRMIAAAQLVVLSIACVWSFEQANRIVDFASAATTSPQRTVSLGLLEDAELNSSTVSTSANYEPPSGYSTSASERLDLKLDNRLLNGGLDVLSDNLRQTEEAVRSRPTLPIANLLEPDQQLGGGSTVSLPTGTPLRDVARFSIQPGARYLLTYEADLQQAHGVLSIDGERIHSVFFLAPGRGLQYASLWTSGSVAEDLTVGYAATCVPEAAQCSDALSSFHLQTYSEADSPIHVTSWMPYVATVTSDGSTYLETHRIFVPGYHAVVNGLDVQPQPSPRGRVMVPLMAGENRVELDYAGAPDAVAARWVSVAGAVVVLVLCAVGFVASRRTGASLTG